MTELQFAKESGLKYVSDQDAGFSRRRHGKNFRYYSGRKEIKDERTVRRIRALVIPPAWSDVWICKETKGHLQCTGRDARGRKQYRYHQVWTANRNTAKFDRLLHFGECLPAILRRTEKDLKRAGLPKQKVLAAVVRVMQKTRMRIGNDIYADTNETYGLTTILNRHAKIKGSEVRFDFKGKSGVRHQVTVDDARLSKIIRGCQELPGEELFAYKDEDGATHDVTSGDVNDYLRQIVNEDITAKDFRTWGGTVKAVEILTQIGPSVSDTQTAFKKRTVEVIKEVAKHLGNTVAVCRKYYVHPAIFEADAKGLLHSSFARRHHANCPKPYTQVQWMTMQILRIY